MQRETVLSGTRNTASAIFIDGVPDYIMTKAATYKKWTDEKVGSEVKSKIRVTFNRPLTYSEREQWRAAVETITEYQSKFTDPDKLYLESTKDDSRALYADVAEYVERHFVNVHPVAVKTFIPEVKV